MAIIYNRRKDLSQRSRHVAQARRGLEGPPQGGLSSLSRAMLIAREQRMPLGGRQNWVRDLSEAERRLLEPPLPPEELRILSLPTRLFPGFARHGAARSSTEGQ